MVLYGVTLGSLEEELWAADLELLTHFNAYTAAFDGLVWMSSQILKLLLERGP